MQLIRTKGMLRVGYNTFSERKEKEPLSLFFALWRSCSYLCILKFPNNQLLMKKKHLTEGQRYEIFTLLQSGRSQKDIAIQLNVNKSTISRGYKFSYDGLNRLTTAVYGEREDMNNHPNRYDEYVLEYTANGAIKHMQRWGKKNDGVYGKIDNLEITHTGNQLSTVTDDALPVLYDGEYDFKDNTVSVTGAEYQYNGNGSLVSDANKGITKIEYDNMNNPRRIQFTNGNVTEYIYSTSGEKLRTIHRTAVANITVSIGSTLPLTKANTLSVDSTDYIDNIIFHHGRPDKFLFNGGYCSSTANNQPVYHYYTQDHLGNNRAVVNENGTLEQVTHYYPFGDVYGDTGLNASAQQYKYNGKELDRMHGLDWYDYGARNYDAAVPMWTSVDPLCEKYYDISPYVYCMDNPVKNIDTDGKKVIVTITTNVVGSGEMRVCNTNPNQMKDVNLYQMTVTDDESDYVESNYSVTRDAYGISQNGEMQNYAFEPKNDDGQYEGVIQNFPDKSGLPAIKLEKDITVPNDVPQKGILRSDSRRPESMESYEKGKAKDVYIHVGGDYVISGETNKDGLPIKHIVGSYGCFGVWLNGKNGNQSIQTFINDIERRIENANDKSIIVNIKKRDDIWYNNK